MSQYQPLLSAGLVGEEGLTEVQNFEKGKIRNSMSAWVVLKSPCQSYLPWGGLSMFLVKEDWVKWNKALKAQFSNVNPSLF